MIGPYELDTIYTGDARELAKAIPDESVDLIFTDPVYDRIDDYRWLAETGARILKPDSACLTFCGIGYLDKTLDALLSDGLHYRWLLSVFLINNMNLAGSNWLYRKWQALLWLEKGRGNPRNGRLQDLRVETIRPGDKNHAWTKMSSGFSVRYYTEGFTNSGAIVFDPFTGGGTVPAVCKLLGRHYLAFEIDPATAEMARERVRNTQPPLFTDDVKQLAMGGLDV